MLENNDVAKYMDQFKCMCFIWSTTVNCPQKTVTIQQEFSVFVANIQDKTEFHNKIHIYLLMNNFTSAASEIIFKISTYLQMKIYIWCIPHKTIKFENTI